MRTGGVEPPQPEALALEADERGNIVQLAPEDIAVPRTGALQVMNGHNRRRGRDPHEIILPSSDGRRLPVHHSQRLWWLGM